jgi:hypothetical protein
VCRRRERRINKKKKRKKPGRARRVGKQPKLVNDRNVREKLLAGEEERRRREKGKLAQDMAMNRMNLNSHVAFSSCFGVKKRKMKTSPTDNTCNPPEAWQQSHESIFLARKRAEKFESSADEEASIRHSPRLAGNQKFSANVIDSGFSLFPFKDKSCSL